MPLPRSRASSAAVAGIGEALPTATWRESPISRAITSASSSSSRKSRCPFFIDVPFEIFGEPFFGAGQPRVFGKMLGIDSVVIGQRQRPGAALGHRDAFDIEARQGSGGKNWIVEQISVVNFLDSCH